MCGIIGTASVNLKFQKEDFRNQRDIMSHRGPDDAGIWYSDDTNVILAHRRLSIIDLSSAGQQPMIDEANKLCIVLNGEIYNYKELRIELMSYGYNFKTSTDTEVLLAAYTKWNTNCINYLNGMFAFGLYDIRLRRLFIARDRAGEKPLFYSLENGVLKFASELKALLADRSCSRRINQNSLDYYLTFGFTPSDQSLISGIHKLPPAHACTFNIDRAEFKKWRYWHLPEYNDSRIHCSRLNQDDLLGELDSLLEDSVRKQLVADVPVGILLSGGVDSSLITAMAKRSNSKFKTFTIRFPGYEKYDETNHARLIANHFNTDHVELDAAETTVDLLSSIARQFDEPIIDSSMIPTFLLCQIVRKHCTVALGGDGGDELFGGYHHYDHLLRMQKNISHIPYFFRSILANSISNALPIGFKGRNWIQGFSTDFTRGVHSNALYFDKKYRKKLYSLNLKNIPFILTAEKNRYNRIPNNIDLLQRITRLDFENYLPEDILVKVDRCSMLNSLEVRAPFLDYRVIEFAFSKVPSHFKATTTKRKIILKSLARKILPTTFNLQRKQGFSIPLSSWLKTDSWYRFFKDTLLTSDNPFFDFQCIKKLLEGQQHGRSNSERLFALVLFELWRKENQIIL